MVSFTTSSRVGFSQGRTNVRYTCPLRTAYSTRHRVNVPGGVPLSESTDSIDDLKADLAGEPEAAAYLREQLHLEAENFLTLCVKCARDIEKMDDVWKARSIIFDVTVWAKELKTRLDKEVFVTTRPKNTIGAFKR